MANNYRIKDGVAFRPYGSGSLLTNENLSDAIAEMFISKNPKLLNTVFEKVETEKSEAVNEVKLFKKRGRKKKSI